MVPPAMFVTLVLLVAAAKNALDVVLVAGTQQNLSNIYSLDIYTFNLKSELLDSCYQLD